MFATLAQRRGIRQFIKFGLVGLSGFIVNLVVFTVLQRFDPHHAQALHFNILYSIGFLSGGVSNYYFNRIWTFRSTRHAVREGTQFLLVSGGALIFGLIVSALVAPYLGHGHKLWLAGTVSGMFFNFFANKYWTFKDTA